MPLQRWFEHARRIPGAPDVQGRRVDAQQWRDAAQAVAANGGRLLSLWGSVDAQGDSSVLVALQVDSRTLLLELPCSAGSAYPGLQDLFPAASRLQRAVADVSGLISSDPDRRPWLRHAPWPAGYHPLREDVAPAGTAPAGTAPAATAPEAPAGEYEFVRVTGDGVHEIGVGPVHAGVIEPGHFRLSVVGEKVLWLEERLGYVHKGIEQRFAQLPLSQAHRLAARISGDSAVAFSWAYCQALEGLAGMAVPERALWLRALALELERMANHLGDLGALGNDAGFAFALAQFSRLKEQLLRAIESALGQRYLMDFVVPGGTRLDLDRAGAAQLRVQCLALRRDVSTLREIFDDSEGVRDRFVGAGVVAPALARRLGLTGMAGRASGQDFDLRLDQPCAPYERLMPARMVRTEGDVAARVALRFDELLESIRLVGLILAQMPEGAHTRLMIEPDDAAFGIGLIEGWRGPVMIALEAGPGGSIRRCHPHDPSWQNWPVLQHAILDNIVADFPLVNKSFNLSYSGHDL
jgi:Ni,Fe-hydrogenase III large subunit/Ni,Fe-hydrogenase III component G